MADLIFSTCAFKSTAAPRVWLLLFKMRLAPLPGDYFFVKARAFLARLLERKRPRLLLTFYGSFSRGVVLVISLFFPPQLEQITRAHVARGKTLH